jgi:hypothetical protein
VGVSPPVVHDAVRHGRVVVAEQLEEAERAPVLTGIGPLDVVPDEGRFLAID